MSERRRGLVLYSLGLLVFGAATTGVRSPGYMDADYYFATARELFEGNGLSEPFLWNYLDDPVGLPHPSHLYWMPLPTFLASGSMYLLGNDFRFAQLPFVLLAAALPPISAYFGQRLSGDSRKAWMAGLFALFPGFFLPFFITVDSFAIFALAGSLALWLMALSVRDPRSRRWFFAGVLIGLGGLARADGLLLLPVAVLALVWSKNNRRVGSLALLVGLLLVLAPWWVRNFSEIGSPFNTGSQRLLWMLSYDDLFAFPAAQLTLERWVEAGLQPALNARLAALSTNLQRMVGEAGMVFLAPFMVIGVIRRWEHPFVRLGTLYLVSLFVVMTVVFPFVGSRGALFHSISAVLPMLWALTPVGLWVAIRWLGMRRGWNVDEAWRVLGTSAVILAAVVATGLYANRFYLEGDGWNSSSETYRTIAAHLSTQEGGTVAINNPPGLAAHSQLEAVVIPNGSEAALRAVADTFGVRWVVLEANHPEGLNGLYADPHSTTWLELHHSLADNGERPIYIFEVAR